MRLLPPLLFVVLSAPNGFSSPEPAREKLPEDVLRLRDPFKRLAKPKQAMEIPKSDLETVPVDKFKMIGVLTGKGLAKMKAILEAPGGRSYFVSEGTHIGPKKGIIRKITPNAVHVRERVMNVLGEEENIDQQLVLPSQTKDGKELNLGASW